MRRRLMIVLMVLMGAAMLLLSLPLADSYASGRTERLLLQRRSEAVRFADLADRVRTRADRIELSAEISRYAELYGASLVVVDTTGRTVARAGTTLVVSADSTAGEALRRALTGRSTEQLPTVRPWGPDTVVLAEPVGQDERVSGAVLVAAPTDAARRDVSVRWSLIAAGALSAFSAAALAAVAIARWLMRPVRDLDRAVEGLAAGSLQTRVVTESGPPELRRLRKHFNAMAEAVADSVGRQRDFVADASHQLRNPLATLVLRLENVEPHLHPGPGRDEHARALEEAERLEELLDGLLALARVESGTTQPVDQDVSRAVRERVAAWGPVFRDAQLELTVTAVPDGLTARALPDAVGRFLDAVLDNATKFIPPCGHVEVRAVPRDGEVTVSVCDDGPGADEEQLPLLIRRFARAPEHQNVPGSGLGLAIVDEIAQLSGGRLTVAGNLPHGLVLELTLPSN
ncbi:sensor histidine kinase [Streptomyces olivochromogenes]|uniref:sensor histidine kinase n=1 Tax=Streptomyces olivochromogenes TaxID=1963 RepID=UPI001F20312E|nr:HAMP domain-containing sensor histidine kinase [Streptomyces olivochromogenes]MCF3132252.1 HAMP domain-containing histidine kinase [Streptomyces olivochromogenes]